MPGIDQYTKLLLHMDGDTSSEIGGNDGYTKLLCHMDTTPFIDDSHSIYSITNNNVTVNTSIKKFGGGSAAFDGSTAYLSIADSNDWDFGTGDFTIDCWVRFSDITGFQAIYEQGEDGTDNHTFFKTDAHKLRFYATTATAVSADISMTNAWSGLTVDQWYHLAVVRNGASCLIFIDGVSQALTVSTAFGTLPNDGGPLNIGRNDYGDQYYFKGYIDELRISKGIARWTDTFTPPTTYYGGHTLVPSGNPKLDSATKKFGSSSMYFDGSTGHLSIGNHSDWSFGSEDFTIDFWVKSIGSISDYEELMVWNNVGGGNTGWQIDINPDRKIRVGAADVSSYFISDVFTTALTEGQWHHVAFVRNGNEWYGFLDGNIELNETHSNIINPSSNVVYIGRMEPGYYFNGYLDEIRISKGTARWTSNFTPPTAAYETDGYTKLLLHFPGDMSEYAHAVTFNGDSRIDVTPTKWTGSFYFDGDDYLIVTDSDDWYFGADDFTIDFWFNIETLPSLDAGYSFYQQFEDVNDRLQIYFYRTSGDERQIRITFRSGGNNVLAEGSLLTGDLGIGTSEWHHLAFVRNGSSMVCYVDGNSEVSGTVSTDPSDIGADLEIGVGPGGSLSLIGRIDEARVSKGIARWTSNFTPPTEPYSINYISGQLNFAGRIIALRETDWTIVHNELHDSGSYMASGLGPDPVTVIFRKSDGDSQGYGNIIAN